MKKFLTIMKVINAIGIVGIILAIIGYFVFMTDAKFQRLFNLGKNARVTCYSGGKVVLDTWSTGKIESSSSSDGYFFKDYKTNRLREVSGDCHLDYGAPQK